LSHWHALQIALLTPQTLDLPGIDEREAGLLIAACRWAHYPCPRCRVPKPADAYTLASIACQLCGDCLRALLVEDAHETGWHDGRPDPECPTCRDNAPTPPNDEGKRTT
jgi:hypothetical protein